MKVFTQCAPPEPQSEKIDTQDIACLDKTSITSVVDFIRKFQADATFSPPTKEVAFDSDKFDINIDSEGEFPNLYDDIELLGEDK